MNDALKTKDTMNQESEYMDTKQLAAYIKVCPRTVANMRKKGQLPFINLGDRVLFRRASVDAALSQLEVTI